MNNEVEIKKEKDPVVKILFIIWIIQLIFIGFFGWSGYENSKSPYCGPDAEQKKIQYQNQ